MHVQTGTGTRPAGAVASGTAFYIQHNVTIAFLCFATGILAGIGAGIYRNIDEAFEVIKRDEDVIYPNPKNTEIYKQLYDRFYRGLYGKLMDVNKDIEEVLKILSRSSEASP